MNNYETVIIMTPVLSEGELKKAIEKYMNYLKTNGAQIIHEDHWGLRQMAYPIRKKTTGFYHVVEFQSDSQLVAKLEVDFKRDENILRFLTVKLDKYAIKYNDDVRKGLVGRKKNKDAAAEKADAGAESKEENAEKQEA